MNINFLLPGICRVPTGGAKVVFEYANRMAADGVNVTIIYPLELQKENVEGLSLGSKLRMHKKMFTKRLKQNYSARAWFPLDEKVTEKLVPALADINIPDAELTFATAWETAVWLAQYPVSKGRKWYLIQNFEEWSGTKEEVTATWKLRLNKMVISRWLQAFAVSLGEQSLLINNGLDFTTFRITKPIEDRLPASVIMLYHHLEVKGSGEGLAALELVRKSVPHLQVTLFSAYERPDFIPDWITYYHQPKNLTELYNNAALFISPSWLEGWSLPPAEAMQCGCCVVVTDIGGHRDYGIDGEDLILVPVKDPTSMASALLQLIENNSRRIQIARSGNTTIQQFTWEAAYQKLKKEIVDQPSGINPREEV